MNGHRGFASLPKRCQVPQCCYSRVTPSVCVDNWLINKKRHFLAMSKQERQLTSNLLTIYASLAGRMPATVAISWRWLVPSRTGILPYQLINFSALTFARMVLPKDQQSKNRFLNWHSFTSLAICTFNYTSGKHPSQYLFRMRSCAEDGHTGLECHFQRMVQQISSKMISFYDRGYSFLTYRKHHQCTKYHVFLNMVERDKDYSKELFLWIWLLFYYSSRRYITD